MYELKIMNVLHGLWQILYENVEIQESSKERSDESLTIFNRYTNMSPIEYVRYYRIEKSFEYLRDTDMTITEIAFAVGFAGASYYTETFRQHMGCSPTEARQMIGPP